MCECHCLCSDVDDLDDITNLGKYIEASADVLIFLSAGYWSSSNCLIEARSAIQQQKPIVLVAEQDPKKGGQPIETTQLATPPELREPVYGVGVTKRRIIPWVRMHELQLESLRQ
eukprot:5881225-Prymnesium_polylepis.1